MPQRISGDRVLLSTTEAVQLSGLSREHIQRLLRQKLLEGMKLGHDWLLLIRVAERVAERAVLADRWEKEEEYRKTIGLLPTR